MNINALKVTFIVIGVVSLAFMTQGCGKNGGSSPSSLVSGTVGTPPVTPPPPGPTISGTAATGAPIPDAVVTIKDPSGQSKTGTTDDNGKYSIDVTGMTPPFLLKVDPASGASLFSFGLQQTGNVNIHPYTNLMIGIWYKLKGLDVEDAFATMGSTTPVPSAIEVSTLSRITNHILQIWITKQGLAPKSFDFITTPFDTNDPGFDGVLKLTQIDPNTDTVTIYQDSNTNQISTLSWDPSTSAVSVTTDSVTATTAGQVHNSTRTSFVIPTTASLQTALNGVNVALSNVVATANSSNNLIDLAANLAEYFDDGYMQDGFGNDVGAASLATLLQGVAANLKSFSVYRIVSFDGNSNVIQVVPIFSWTQNGDTLLRMVNKGGGGLYFKLHNGSWLIYGNQQSASVGAQGITVNTMSGDLTDGVTQNFQVQVTAPTGTLADVKATVGATDYQLTQWSTVLVDSITSVPKDVFTNVPVLTQIPPLGTSTAFTLTTTAAGPLLFYNDTLDATTTEPIQITNLGGHTLDDAHLDNLLTVEWTLPISFPIGHVELTGLVTADGSSCKVYSQVLGASATSGTITLPATCGGYPVVSNGTSSGPDPAVIQVTVWGVNDEQTQVQYHFR
ncbi:MAG TPA: carboxypeptidase-like regulatory domain-containing protein [Nitrospiria bacterium]|jgi:hypothetical protein|nr:carboxypeptidase-like regulatory domain-containing protein [Nitrospiria bacterium]